MNEFDTVAADLEAVRALTLLREARRSSSTEVMQMHHLGRSPAPTLPTSKPGVVVTTLPTSMPYVRPNTPGPLATARQEAEARIRELQRQPASMQRDSKIRAERDFVALADRELRAGGA